MRDGDLKKVTRVAVTPGDLVVLTVKDDADDVSIEGLRDTLAEFALDSKTFILVFRERVFSDIRKLALTELLLLQTQIEQAIVENTARDSVGNA